MTVKTMEGGGGGGKGNEGVPWPALPRRRRQWRGMSVEEGGDDDRTRVRWRRGEMAHPNVLYDPCWSSDADLVRARPTSSLQPEAPGVWKTFNIFESKYDQTYGVNRKRPRSKAQDKTNSTIKCVKSKDCARTRPQSLNIGTTTNFTNSTNEMNKPSARRGNKGKSKSKRKRER